MKIVLLNTHSVLNSGDAAIVAAEVTLLRAALGDAQIVATSRTPERDLRFLRDMGVEVLPPLFPAPSTWSSAGGRVSEPVRDLFAVGPKRWLVRAIAEADLVVSSGGGYFYSYRRWLPGPVFFQAYSPLLLAQHLRKPVLFAPQSFGPLTNRFSGILLRRLLCDEAVLRVLVREQESLAFLQSLLGCRVAEQRLALCPDLAFAFDRRDNEPLCDEVRGLPRPILAVTVREWHFPHCRCAAERRTRREAYLAGVSETCQSFQASFGGSVLVVPQARGPGRAEDDRTISQELVERLVGNRLEGRVRMASIEDDAPPQRVFRLIAAADLVLATRFHSAIFACLAGIPFVALGYQPKTAGIMAMLALEEFAVPITEVSEARLLPLLETLLYGRESLVNERIRPAAIRLAGLVRGTMRDTLGPWRLGVQA